MHPTLSSALQRQLGLKPELLQQLEPDEQPWRISSVYGNRCTVLGISPGEATIIERQAEPPLSPVAVGDWVILETSENEGWRVAKILEPLTSLCREAVNEQGKVQWIASNLDTVFIVAAFAETEKLEQRSIRARRLDRFISGVKEGGATAVVLLNKLDLSSQQPSERAEHCNELRSRLGGVEVLCVSADHQLGIEQLDRWLAEGQTVAFVGASGVGKSSLVNALNGDHHLDVGSIRAKDTKGRHTTTRRELLRLPSGALVIDTPGMREFAAVAEDRVHGFEEITELAATCRFSDCAHDSEPGCAVRCAIENGSLRKDRFASYRDMELEAKRMRAKRTPHATQARRKQEKRFGRTVKQAVKNKKVRT